MGAKPKTVIRTFELPARLAEKLAGEAVVAAVILLGIILGGH